MANIHPTALVSADAAVADDAEVGAYAVVGAHVSVGSGSVIGPFTRIEGPVTIGERNKIAESPIHSTVVQAKFIPPHLKCELALQARHRPKRRFADATANDEQLSSADRIALWIDHSSGNWY